MVDMFMGNTNLRFETGIAGSVSLDSQVAYQRAPLSTKSLHKLAVKNHVLGFSVT